jgi:hypothetical protein
VDLKRQANAHKSKEFTEKKLVVENTHLRSELKAKSEEIESLRDYILKLGDSEQLESQPMHGENDSGLQSIDSYIADISDLRIRS